jgi:hypothetical protein
MNHPLRGYIILQRLLAVLLTEGSTSASHAERHGSPHAIAKWHITNPVVSCAQRVKQWEN